MLVDFHNHILPGVDDGARDAGETAIALRSMHDAGVGLVIATPHFAASLLSRDGEAAEYRSRITRGWEEARRVASLETPGLRLELGAEVLLDSLGASLADPALRLLGSDFVLVEFSLYGAPPNAKELLSGVRRQGWRPILAHPERYLGLTIAELREWHTNGIPLQLNAGSVLGDYGPRIRERAWELLDARAVDYLCGDYHARGEFRVPAALEAIKGRVGARQCEMLVENGLRLSRTELPLHFSKQGWRSRLRSLFKR